MFNQKEKSTAECVLPADLFSMLGKEEVNLVSNCCGAVTTEPDSSMAARCSDCGEGCIAEKE